MISASPTTVAFLGCSSLLLLWLLRKYPNSKAEFPGPWQLPLLGNILDVPLEQVTLGYSRMGNQYGPVTRLVVPGRTILVLNSYDAMHELLEKRGSNYIERPRMAMLHDLVGMDFPTPFRGADKAWRQHRKLLRPALSLDTIKSQYSGLILTSAHRYLRSLKSEPDRFLLNPKRSIGRTVLELTYGAYHDGQGTDYIIKQDELLECTKAIGVGYLVDIFPLLKYVPAWFPGAKFQREASQWKEELYSLRALMREGVEKRMAADEGLSCYVANELQKLEDQKGVTDGEVEAIHDSGFSFYQAGTDTIEIALRNFLLAMNLFPKVQARAQREVDRVLGNQRPPNFSDQENMPYINALVLECYRWNPPATILFPHTNREDDTYNGILIPRGTMILANAWGLSRNAKIYDDPSAFRPERFVDDPNILNPRDFVFGFGRRTCPGMHLAHQLVWTYVVSVLWTYELKRPEGEPPLDKDIDRFDLRPLSSAKPFPCEFIPRQEAMDKLLCVPE